MRRRSRFFIFPVCVLLASLFAEIGRAEDWPQWLGANRNARVTGFTAPKAWPKQLTKKWQVTVGNGVATPALVGDKLYVFAREGGNEVTRCLDAATGTEVWSEKYETAFSGKGDQGFPGPRSSPAVADGKVVTLGVNGTLSCLDAAKGTKLWRIETKAVPIFHTSSSPVIVDKLAIVQFGSERNGGVGAYDLATGDQKWKWTDEGTAYASPVVMTVGGTKTVVVETTGSIVGLSVADGKQLWKTSFAGGGMRSYNAATPIVDGSTVVVSGSGRGVRAIKVEKKDAEFTTKDTWHNKDYSAKFNTPIVRDGKVYGLTERNTLFCISAGDGKKVWENDLGGGGRGAGYGSVVDLGPVLMALTPSAQLIVFEPGGTEYKEVASYKVAGGDTYAYPIISGKRIFIKDRDALTMFVIE